MAYEDLLSDRAFAADPEAEAGSNAWAKSRVRRSFDIAFALFLLFFLLPLLVITALFIKVGSPGPILYRQTRVGLGGRPFEILKFRSMATDAEADGKARWAAAGDPRVTPVGRFIRLVRIDELPQLINVLRGDMSLIGPRPERPEFVSELAELLPHYNRRHQVFPGITGLAQVEFVYAASVEDAKTKLAYDLDYVERCSPGLDLRIVGKTVAVILSGKGAH